MTSPGYTSRKETPKRWSVMSPAGQILASYFLQTGPSIHPQVLAMAHAWDLNESVREACERGGITVTQLFENLENAAEGEQP
jgi:hypothetical protein